MTVIYRPLTTIASDLATDWQAASKADWTCCSAGTHLQAFRCLTSLFKN